MPIVLCERHSARRGLRRLLGWTDSPAGVCEVRANNVRSGHECLLLRTVRRSAPNAGAEDLKALRHSPLVCREGARLSFSKASMLGLR